MALSPRDKREIQAMIDAAIGALGVPVDSEQLTADEQLAQLQARIYNLDIENRLLHLTLHGQQERAAIETIARHLGISVDLEGGDGDGQGPA